ncbi:MAG TPA: nucleoside deaminase, partial [Flavobacteriaceae bacterium]|nr:nucleoside deaminase [Flavobacteriaceae bacterium]
AQMALSKGEVPIGAVVVIDNQIIARGHNLTETLNDVTAHAEILAITAAENYLGGKFLDGCTMYVTLEPCQMCAGALYWSRISHLFYAAKDLKRGFTTMGSKLHPKTKVSNGVLENESKDMLEKFFITRRNLN